MGETEERVARGCFNSIPRPQARWEAIKVFAGEDMEATVTDDLSIPLSPNRGSREAPFRHPHRTSLVVQRLRLFSNAGSAGLIPGCGTKIPHAKKVKKKRHPHNSPGRRQVLSEV